MERLLDLCPFGAFLSQLTAETDRRLFQQQPQRFPDLATEFSTPAGIFQRGAVTQRCCAIAVVKSGAARAPNSALATQ